MDYNNEIEAFEKKNNKLGRSFLISASFGTGFGLLFMIILLFFDKTPETFVYIIPPACGLVAGISGVLGSFLASFLKKIGLENNLIIRFISFIIVLLFSVLITLAAFSFYAGYSLDSYIKNNMVYGFIIGGTFGLIVMLLEYQFWKNRKKVLTLELENKYLGELAEKDKLLQETSKDLYIAEERNRMARELHDSISQGIHGIIYTSKSLQYHLEQDTIDKDKLLNIVGHLDETAQVTLSELRSMIMELKPAILEDKGLSRPLTLLLDLFEKRQNIDIEQDIEDIKELTPEQEVAIYRIVQEALANIQKHSAADHLQISLKKTSQNNNSLVKLLINDNGKGFDTRIKSNGNGINNMKIRSQQNGGLFNIESIPDKGTKIEVTFQQ